MQQFRSKVEDNCDSPEERLMYLEQYTTGEPQQIVIGYSYLKADGYSKALSELDRRYGDQDIIVSAFITKALSWGQIRGDDPKELDRFSIFLAECENAVSCLDALKVLEYSENFKKIVGKLPYVLHDKWRNIVYQAKEKGSRVKFGDLVSFVRREASKMNDPTFGREAMKVDLDKKTHNVLKRPKGTFATKKVDVKDLKSESVKLPNTTNSNTKNDIQCKNTVKNDMPVKYTQSQKNNFDNTMAQTDRAFRIPCMHCGGQRKPSWA